MDKPYTTIQCNGYQLTIYHGIDPLDPDNDNVDVHVTFPNGDSFSAVFFTLQNIATLMKGYEKTGEGANGLYFWTSDMLIVQKLTEQAICQLPKPKDLGLLVASNNVSCVASCKPLSRASFLFLVS